jgi:hypothetical protein
MDVFIEHLPGEEDGDLMICEAYGVSYQIDRENLCNYDAAYYDKCASYEGKDIGEAINAGRIALVQKHFGPGPMVDVGIGSGEFIRKRPNTWGHDVNPAGIEWLKRQDLFVRRLHVFGAASFWDVLEHVDDPGYYLRQIDLRGYVFASLPIFNDLRRVRESKHYRPGEHLYYWTEAGFIAWMDRHGFQHLETQDFETKAGRDSILSFAFRRYRSLHE